ncbi:unnamed protein product (macronuclear) [Paramecium tetraurelia]|uniref:Hyaluronan/mRNA-binding protein domain-containing protein n=1 Tax=Paramecium tetraurelia TaxID=5888 RepID=A0EG89_PARTE|nr:uncharacterized protein GSPATT00026654001 [Paramecium tetraurelia]CAK94330.1 unnamed protein product [Paramecium tetraurelia]|eukprot:XP_001461703.1 hypothetical protein (macronuclear) [Paramecium tetraurelia strain d4-2]
MSTNMFNVLNISDDEDSKTQQAQQKTQQQQAKKNKQKREQEQLRKKALNIKIQHQNKRVLTADPHPKDRHSGTGIGKELRKEGGGRRNWGNYKDDLKQEKYQGAIEGKEAQQEQNTEQQAEEQQPQENVPQPPAEKTLADYYQARGANVEDILKKQEQKPQPVVKIDEEALKKEKLQVMRTREDEKREKEQKAAKKSSGQQQGYRSEMEYRRIIIFSDLQMIQKEMTEMTEMIEMIEMTEMTEMKGKIRITKDKRNNNNQIMEFNSMIRISHHYEVIIPNTQKSEKFGIYSTYINYNFTLSSLVIRLHLIYQRQAIQGSFLTYCVQQLLVSQYFMLI